MRRLLFIFIAVVAGVSAAFSDTPEAASAASPTDSAAVDRPRSRRHVTPVNNAATRTQYVNDARGDSARMLERRRARSIHYHDEQGRTVMVDTVTGQEWVDSTLLPPPPRMIQPLIYDVEIGVNVWDPVMRIFGQKYGGVDFSACLNMHNRYLPTFEAGFGMAEKTPADMNYTYKSPLAPYFKIGADYNFIYNSDPDYRFTAGLRYGFSAFRFTLENVTVDDYYWDELTHPTYPDASVTAGWFEVVVGLRVRIAGPVSAGWTFRYHSILHRTHPTMGDAWYIPGYGTENSSLGATFSIVYNFGLTKKKKDNPVDVDTGEGLPPQSLPADNVEQPDGTQNPIDL